ncbi:HlyD family type I secretion periplasmic adaptor subunit [Pelosinus sp. IPA-1]|uniref:HlyD family type I secretion periplasmic adaptor subunit n=1 Tax=Pelosinus sp. IPA-1 TaxID=3029569 RepID=UPI002436281C|nr:HlyD family type I secretion periplasmic adaptor subunit [Pelosinus sp. IPA-1]GMB01644.1 HlyD family type I secretion periplasmic adaptor subunit [Pelosinus sp. IPA-1]
MLSKLLRSLNEKLNEQWPQNETEFLPAALEVLETPPSPVGRIMMWTFFVVITSIILWTFIGHVDEVAVAPGKLIPIGYVKTVQAEDKGVVKAIHVKDGQKVTQGQLLLELDTTFTAADMARNKKEMAYYRLEIERLMAEMEERVFTPQKDPDLEDKDISFQVGLYQSRLAEYKAKLATAEFNVSQSLASLRSSRATYDKYASLYEIAREKEKRIEQLVSENAVSTFTLFDHQEKRLELEHNISSQAAEIARLEWAVQQSQEAVTTIKTERNRDITSKMVDDRKQFQAYAEEVKKAEEKDRLSRIVAPIDGKVSQLAVHTIGGIVTAAQPLMDIVPEDAELQVEAWVANKDIGFIQQGQPAEVKIETFSFQRYGTLGATVVEISPDAVEDKDKGRVYRVLLSLDKNSFLVNDRYAAVSSGMTATGEIKIRQKRIIEFFLDPFRQYQSEALRER